MYPIEIFLNLKNDLELQKGDIIRIYSEEETGLKQIASTISEAKSQGAQLIVSSCTLSHTMMDIYQGKASRISGTSTNLPIIHLSEILSFAFGHHNSRLAQFRTRLAVIGD